MPKLKSVLLFLTLFSLIGIFSVAKMASAANVIGLAIDPQSLSTDQMDGFKITISNAKVKAPYIVFITGKTCTDKGYPYGCPVFDEGAHNDYFTTDASGGFSITVCPSNVYYKSQTGGCDKKFVAGGYTVSVRERFNMSNDLADGSFQVTSKV